MAAGMALKPLADWGLPMGRVFLAAGPCSAESEAQVLATARGLVGRGIGFLRAGLWKPRTHPGGFDGVGLDGLAWLRAAKQETGIPVGVEVALPAHVEACLTGGIDVLWVGARTTPDPFAVQAIADALAGSDVPVLVKNPISPDIELWIGAIERLHEAGLTRIGAIHRGFSTARKTRYRFSPDWRIPIELRRRLPRIPLLCDPSHICGDRALIPVVAQAALDLLYDGLMVEVHCDPDRALTDARQQLSPAGFGELVARLVVKRARDDDQGFQAELAALRQTVDELDEQVLELLGERMGIVRRMGALKRAHGVSVLQPQRWEAILESRLEHGREHDLAGDFVFRLYEIIHEEAIRQQEDLGPGADPPGLGRGGAAAG